IRTRGVEAVLVGLVADGHIAHRDVHVGVHDRDVVAGGDGVITRGHDRLLVEDLGDVAALGPDVLVDGLIYHRRARIDRRVLLDHPDDLVHDTWLARRRRRRIVVLVHVGMVHDHGLDRAD